MDPLVIDVAIALASLGLYAVAYGGALLATRPASPAADPATPDLSEEPPAVVNLLGNRWRLNEDAAEATLLDLAARRLIELRQPGNDPMQTTVYLRPADPGQEPESLRPYERRVLARIRGLAVDGVVPVTALTFRNQNQARGWNRRLRKEVAADARSRGLSRRRLDPVLVSGLVAVAAITAAGLALAVLRLVLRTDESELSAPFWAGGISFLILAGLVSRQHGERDTAAGRAAAARWLGVRDWLRGHEEFADLPPAAVAVWDRYLPYGAALGVTHTASSVLDLGMGDRELVWSSYQGRWRRVRVRYPRLWTRYGRSVPSLLVPAAFALVAGGLLVRFHDLPDQLGITGDDPVARGLATAAPVALWVGVTLLVRGAYRAVRALVDLATTRTITGEVLWVELWRTRSQGKNRPRVPWLHYLAVDDGSAERTTAWGVPHTPGGPSCQDGDIVRIRVRPWTRRVVELKLLQKGRASRIADPPVAEEAPDGEGLSGVVAGVLSGVTDAGAARGAETLLTAEEVGRALGVRVRQPERLPGPGFVTTVMFHSADRGRQVMMMQAATGTAARWAWRANARDGTPLPDIGDEARSSGDRAAMRVGEATVVLTLLREARGRHSHVPWLLQRAAARLAGPDATGPDPAAQAAAAPDPAAQAAAAAPDPAAQAAAAAPDRDATR